MSLTNEEAALKKEFLRLFSYLQRIRKELSTIRTPSATEDQFLKMADQLDAIVESTEEATNTIMEAMEDLGDLISKIRGRVDDPETIELIDKAEERANSVFEACSFQDITGQRITKVVRSLKFVEERVNSLISMWRPEELVEVAEDLSKEADEDPDKKLLDGPQRKGVAINQSDVDRILEQTHIDKLFD
jgi:chemotaxis protein CheZ